MAITLARTSILHFAELLENCEFQAEDTPKIADDFPGMTWDDAYEIQRRKIDRGNKIVGLKCGFTSYAKMKQMACDSAIFGWMADYYSVNDGAEVRVADLVHPKAEPEIAFVTKKRLKGLGCHIGAVLAATEFVMLGIEVMDSRYREFKCDLLSVIADSTSAACFVVGGRALPADRVKSAHPWRGDGEKR